jgi:hypothetical protein
MEIYELFNIFSQVKVLEINKSSIRRNNSESNKKYLKGSTKKKMRNYSDICF